MGIMAFLTVVFGILDESQTTRKTRENKAEAQDRLKRWNDNNKQIKSIQDKMKEL